MVGREILKDELVIRARWLILGRVLLTTLLLASLYFVQQQYEVYEFRKSVLYYLFAGIYIVSVIYWFYLKVARKLPLFVFVQIAGDIGTVTFLVFLTGGIDSAFSPLYHLTIISASIILYRRGGYLAASLASIFYGGMLDLQYYNVLGFIRSQSYSATQVLYLVFINIVSFYTIAFLSSYLSERLRRVRQELSEKSHDYADLRALQESILRCVGSGILTMDLFGRITSWNPAAESITGYDHSMIRERWQELFAENIKSIFGHTDDMKERPFRFEGEIIKKDGMKAILGFTASLLKDEHDTVSGFILVFQDITKIVEMEEQVRKQDRLATVGSLAAGIAHEIRNPLASLSGSIQVLQDELDLRDDNRNLMEIVLKETERLNIIITEFLEYARPKAIRDEDINMQTLIEETITLIQHSREFKKEIRIRSDVENGMIIRGDSKRMRQVFWNLLLNSCQAITDSGEISIRGIINGQSNDGSKWAEISIADNGRGIISGDINKIFDPFFTTKPGGSGLGLAIVFRIVDEHKGAIIVTSEPHKGSVFTIRLPFAAKPADILMKANAGIMKEQDESK